MYLFYEASLVSVKWSLGSHCLWRVPGAVQCSAFMFKNHSYNFCFIVAVFNQHPISFVSTAAAFCFYCPLCIALSLLGGPSFPTGPTPLSAAKTLFYFRDLSALKAILWLEGICLLSFSHPLSFEGRFWKWRGNLNFSLWLSPGTERAMKMDDSGVLSSSTQMSWASGAHMGLGCLSQRNRVVAKEDLQESRLPHVLKSVSRTAIYATQFM